MHNVQSEDVLRSIGYGEINSKPVISAVWAINKPSTLLNSKSYKAISPFMHPVAMRPRWKSKALIFISSWWALLTLLSILDSTVLYSS